MKKLILVRHGKYSVRDLTEEGREQIIQLSQRIVEIVGDNSIVLFASAAPRTMQSAEIIAEALRIQFEGTEILHSETMQDTMFSNAVDLVKEQRASIVILVTHLEYVNYFPEYFGREVFNVVFPQQNLQRGEGIVIDCDTLEITKI